MRRSLFGRAGLWAAAILCAYAVIYALYLTLAAIFAVRFVGFSISILLYYLWAAVPFLMYRYLAAPQRQSGILGITVGIASLGNLLAGLNVVTEGFARSVVSPELISGVLPFLVLLPIGLSALCLVVVLAVILSDLRAWDTA